MKKKILVIDDDEHILNMLQIFLTNNGYDVILSENTDVIEFLSVMIPDLIILDVQITGSPQTGDEVCVELKKIAAFSHIPVLLMSGEPQLKKIAYSCQADDFIFKLFDLEAILLKIRGLLKAA